MCVGIVGAANGVSVRIAAGGVDGSTLIFGIHSRRELRSAKAWCCVDRSAASDDDTGSSVLTVSRRQAPAKPGSWSRPHHDPHLQGSRLSQARRAESWTKVIARPTVTQMGNRRLDAGRFGLLVTVLVLMGAAFLWMRRRGWTDHDVSDPGVTL